MILISYCFYINYINRLIYSLSYNIAGNNNSIKNLYKFYFDLLNKIDTFFCIENLNIDKDIYPNIYFIDNFYSTLLFKNINNKNDDLYQNFFDSKKVKFLYTSICLLIKFYSYPKVSMKNKNSIMKYFLDSVTEIVVKGINFKLIAENSKDNQYHVCNYNKLLNIELFIYLLLKYCEKNKINFFQDLELFTNIKMIFDLCFKVDEFGILNLIACEGISHLINLYEKKEENLEHYLRLNEIKLNSSKAKFIMNDYVFTFYLIGNIFRNVDYSCIKPFIDKYMNFIISDFNPNDEVARNAYVNQSLFIICDELIKQKEFDKVFQITQIYKMNIIYINGSNKHFFKNKSINETLSEIKLAIIYIKIYAHLSENEKNLIKLILKKIFGEKLYKNNYLMKYALILINEILNQNLENDFSKFIFDYNLIEFLFEFKNKFVHNLLSLNIIFYLLENNYEQIESINNDKDKNKNYIKQKITSYIHKLNDLYHNNENYFYINKIFKLNNNTTEIISNDINKITDFQVCDKMFSNYRLIIMYKKIISKYISKNYKCIDDSINFLKIILQKKMDLYKRINENSSKEKSCEAGEEVLKDNQDLNSDNSKNLFDLNNLKYIFNINVQKFLIKNISKNFIKYVEEIILTKVTQDNKNVIEKTKIDVLSKLMSISMLLLQSEDSWEIKYLGIKLLYKLIKIFSKIKDSRSDDESLLIQQYEVQISSCIKSILNSKSKIPPNFKSIKKGLNLIYLFLTISISNDTEYISKYNEYIHFMNFLENKYTDLKDLKFGNIEFNLSTEKEENIIKFHLFILVCQLFISSYTKKDFSIKYIQKKQKLKNIEIHSSYMAEEIKNYFKEKFKEKISNFFDNLKNCIYKIYDVIIEKEDDINNNVNRNLSYSDKLRLKNASIFLTAISIILHNNLINNYKEVFDINFLMFLYKLIFYLINRITQFKESKEAILYIIDIFAAIMSNNNLILNNEIYSLFLDKFNALLENNEFKDNKNLIFLFQKFTENLLNNQNDISKENYLSLIKKEKELINSLRNKYSSDFDSYFIVIYFNYITCILKKLDEKELEDDFTYYIKLLFEMYYNNNDASIHKLLLEKIFTILLNINKESKNLFSIFKQELIDNLKKISQNFQKYFTLFYIIIQYISKSDNDDLVKELEKYYIEEVLKTENNLYEVSNKSLLVSFSQKNNLNNLNVIQFINEYLSGFLINQNKLSFSQEIQKIILLYIQNEKNNDLRKNIIKSLIKYLNENKDIMTIKDACNFILGIVKINKDDMNLINEEEIKNLLNEEFKNQIDEITKPTENDQSSKNSEVKEDNKDNEDDDEDFNEVE